MALIRKQTDAPPATETSKMIPRPITPGGKFDTAFGSYPKDVFRAPPAVLSLAEKLVYAVIYDAHGSDGSYLAQQTIGQRTGLSSDYVSRIIKSLEMKGWIRTEPRGRGRSYTLYMQSSELQTSDDRPAQPGQSSEATPGQSSGETRTIVQGNPDDRPAQPGQLSGLSNPMSTSTTTPHPVSSELDDYVFEHCQLRVGAAVISILMKKFGDDRVVAELELRARAGDKAFLGRDGSQILHIRRALEARIEERGDCRPVGDFRKWRARKNALPKETEIEKVERWAREQREAAAGAGA